MHCHTWWVVDEEKGEEKGKEMSPITQQNGTVVVSGGGDDIGSGGVSVSEIKNGVITESVMVFATIMVAVIMWQRR